MDGIVCIVSEKILLAQCKEANATAHPELVKQVGDKHNNAMKARLSSTHLKCARDDLQSDEVPAAPQAQDDVIRKKPRTRLEEDAPYTTKMSRQALIKQL